MRLGEITLPECRILSETFPHFFCDTHLEYRFCLHLSSKTRPSAGEILDFWRIFQIFPRKIHSQPPEMNIVNKVCTSIPPFAGVDDHIAPDTSQREGKPLPYENNGCVGDGSPVPPTDSTA